MSNWGHYPEVAVALLAWGLIAALVLGLRRRTPVESEPLEPGSLVVDGYPVFRVEPWPKPTSAQEISRSTGIEPLPGPSLQGGRVSDCRVKPKRCRRCSNAGAFLRLVAGAEWADYYLWNETPFPGGDCNDVAPKLWREGWRVLGWRLGLVRSASKED